MAAIASLYRKCTLMILHLPSAVWFQAFAWGYCSFLLQASSTRLAKIEKKCDVVGVEVPIGGTVWQKQQSALQEVNSPGCCVFRRMAPLQKASVLRIASVYLESSKICQ